LLVGYENQIAQYETLSQIAPTVLIRIFDRPLDEALLDFANLADAEEAGEALRATYQEQINGLIAGLGEGRGNLSVVILNAVSATSFYRVYDQGQAIDTVVDALGVARMEPPADEALEDVALSIEVMPEHMGDVVLVIDYSGEETDPVVSEFLASPILNSLPTPLPDRSTASTELVRLARRRCGCRRSLMRLKRYNQPDLFQLGWLEFGCAVAVVTCRIRSYHSRAEHLQRRLSWAAEIAGKVR
jgi:hypothetical protein